MKNKLRLFISIFVVSLCLIGLNYIYYVPGFAGIVFIRPHGLFDYSPPHCGKRQRKVSVKNIRLWPIEWDARNGFYCLAGTTKYMGRGIASACSVCIRDDTGHRGLIAYRPQDGGIYALENEYPDEKVIYEDEACDYSSYRYYRITDAKYEDRMFSKEIFTINFPKGTWCSYHVKAWLDLGKDHYNMTCNVPGIIKEEPDFTFYQIYAKVRKPDGRTGISVKMISQEEFEKLETIQKAQEQ